MVGYFYPRSPCGERPTVHQWDGHNGYISIHALLAESDFNSFSLNINGPLFLSTLSLRRATAQVCQVVSAELYFYPRSPCGERPLAPEQNATKQRNFYPRSPCGERRASSVLKPFLRVFLSTLSLRRATLRGLGPQPQIRDFYPRSPCGERP